ncbi:MAG: phosphoribosylamine--glycine ligase, partial [bacterium]
AHFAQRNSIDITIVGGEEPLAAGIVNYFVERGLRIFGPTVEACKLEWSKVYAKEFMREFGIPTASYVVFDQVEEAVRFVETHPLPLVIKADGLTRGKGSLIASNLEEAKSAIAHLMIEKALGEAGQRIVIEQFLEGEEATFMAFVDGKNFLVMMPVKDYKRLLDDDLGPNTGGMGSVAPHIRIPKNGTNEVIEKVFSPLIDALQMKGIKYTGILYAGVIFTKTGIKVLEFNSRFGDPETQVILPLMKNDLMELVMLTLEGRLDEIEIEWNDKCAIGVVIASGGYPKRYKKGFPIQGLESVKLKENILLFHSGTAKQGNEIITDGGRVLTVVAVDTNFEKAFNNAYDACEKIKFEKAFYRNDIGQGFIETMTEE